MHTPSEDEKLIEAAEALGMGKLSPEQATKLKEVFGLFMAASPSRIKQLFNSIESENHS